jgi:hypothetical protein
MSFKIKTKQLQNGKWAVFVKNKYYPNTVRDTEIEARVERLYSIARKAHDTIDDVDRELQKLGAYDHDDPHGYLA